MYLEHYSIKAFFFVILENFCHFLILMRFVSFGAVRLVVFIWCCSFGGVGRLKTIFLKR